MCVANVVSLCFPKCSVRITLQWGLGFTSIFPERHFLYSYILVAVGVLSQLVDIKYQDIPLDLQLTRQPGRVLPGVGHYSNIRP